MIILLSWNVLQKNTENVAKHSNSYIDNEENQWIVDSLVSMMLFQHKMIWITHYKREESELVNNIKLI